MKHTKMQDEAVRQECTLAMFAWTGLFPVVMYGVDGDF